jgi:AAA15 family ATPase/GTPase
MLIEFNCQNFLSFKEKAKLNMTTVDAYEEHSDSHIIHNTNREGLSLLKSVAIYGSNGGGKSNFILGMSFMKTVISRSFRDSLEPEKERPTWNFHHRLSTQTVNKPSTFEMSFVISGTIYRYGFTIQDWNIVSEWLFKTEKRETKLFERTGMDFDINNTSFPEGAEHKNVNSNVLLLSYLAQHNATESSKVIEWFRVMNVMDGLENDYVKKYTRDLLERDSNFKEWAEVALRFLEINGIEVEGKELVAVHNKFDENRFVTDQIKLNVETDESHGTRKLVYLLGGLYDTLSSGSLFVIDEFDSKLHPNLTRKLVELFHKYNVNGSQFIITVHDPTLLDKDIYRRDQIQFIDKDQFGASEIYPMSNFKAAEGLRNTSDFRKMYLNCHFGAAESMKIDDELIKLLHHGN